MTNPLSVISNTVPSPFAPPARVVPNRSPAASAIRPARGLCPVGAVEADQSGRRAGVAGAGVGDLEHRAVAVRPAARLSCRTGSRRRRRSGRPTGLPRSVPLKLTSVVGVLASRRRCWRSRTPCHRRSPRRSLSCRTGPRRRRRSDRHRVRPVGAVEADQRGRRAGVAGAGVGDLEHRAIAVRPARVCRAEQVPGGVGDQTGIRDSPRWCR